MSIIYELRDMLNALNECSTLGLKEIDDAKKLVDSADIIIMLYLNFIFKKYYGIYEAEAKISKLQKQCLSLESEVFSTANSEMYPDGKFASKCTYANGNFPMPRTHELQYELNTKEVELSTATSRLVSKKEGVVEAIDLTLKMLDDFTNEGKSEINKNEYPALKALTPEVFVGLLELNVAKCKLKKSKFNNVGGKKR